MVRYSKKYGDISHNIVTWGVEAILNYLFDFKDKTFSSRGKNSLNQNLINYSDHKLSSRQISNTVQYLKKHKFIEINGQGVRAIKLTNKARIRLVEKVVRDIEIDHKHRFISFDIPERLRSQRDKFRRVIKRAGFRQIQLSLWAIDKDVGDIVEMASKEYEVQDYVAYIVSEKSNIEDFVRKTIHRK